MVAILSEILPSNFLWNEAELEAGHPLNAGLLSLALIGEDLLPVLIGSAFIITADKDSCLAVSAAHCFEQVRSLLHPNAKHHPSTPSEFLPPKGEIDLKQVKAFYIKDNAAFVCDIEIAIWDEGTDLAVFKVHAPAEAGDDLFDTFFWISNDIPSPGDPVAFIGFGEMKVVADANFPATGQIQRRLVTRVGLVEAVHPDGFYMLKAPCIEASVSIYSGMSGGLVARWRPEGQIEPFAFISHAPEPQPILDRSISGHAMGSILSAEIKPLADKKQAVGLRINYAGVGKNSKIEATQKPFDLHVADGSDSENDEPRS